MHACNINIPDRMQYLIMVMHVCVIVSGSFLAF